MAQITRRKATTVDELRDRLEAVMAIESERRVPCTHCGGKGEIVSKRPMTNMEVERATGISNGTISNLRKRKSQSAMQFETGMKLLAWIEDQERPPVQRRDADDDDEAPRSPTVRQEGRDRLAAIRGAASAAAASASIDNVNRPLVDRP